MTEWTTIRVTVDAKENAEESKRDGETWNEYLLRCTENPPHAETVVKESTVVDRLDRLETAVHEATDAAQSAEKQIERVTQS